MTALLLAEARKARTVRTTWLLLGAVAALAAIGTAEPLVSAPPQTVRVPLHEQPFLSAPGLIVTIFALVAGLRTVTEEHRHGTIVPTLLVTPARHRVAAAKTLAAAASGALCALLAGAVALVTGSAWLASQDLPVAVTGAVAGWALGLVGVGAAWAVLGAGIGLLVRHQAAAMVGTLLWVTAGEALVGALLPDVAPYLPAAAGRVLTSPWVDDLTPAAAAALLGAWAAAALVAGTWRLLRSDVI